MTRLLTTGYETGDVAESGTSTIGSNSTLSVVNTSPTPRNGGAYCLRVGPPSSGAVLNPTYKSFVLVAAKTDIWVRFGIYIHPASITAEVVFAACQDAGGGAQNCLTWDAATGAVRARLNNQISGTLLASGTSMTPDTWHLIDWRIQCTSSTSGIVEVWLDGNQIINFSGDSINTTTVNVQPILLGLIGNAPSSATGASRWARHLRSHTGGVVRSRAAASSPWCG